MAWFRHRVASSVTRLCFKVRDRTESKSFDAHVFENYKPVVHGCSLGTSDEGGFSRRGTNRVGVDSDRFAFWFFILRLPGVVLLL